MTIARLIPSIRVPPVRVGDLKRLPPAFWRVVALGVVFTLARFSEAFLILRASDQGLPLMWAPLVLVVMNVVYSVGAYPAGDLSDRLPARTLLLWGIAALVGADLMLAFGPGLIGVFVGIALWGAHMALTQGLPASLSPITRRPSSEAPPSASSIWRPVSRSLQQASPPACCGTSPVRRRPSSAASCSQPRRR
ncbi:MAG: MFS transporter [Terricaulis sp.]